MGEVGQTIVTEVAVHCAAGCTSISDADIICEDAEDVGTPNGDAGECTFSDLDIGDGSIDWDATPSGSWGCADIGDEVLEITLSTDLVTRTVFNNGSETGAMYTQVYFKVTSESLADTETAIFLRVMDGASTMMGQMFLVDTSSQLSVHLQYFAGDASTPTSDSYNISTGVQYRLRLQWVDGDPGTWNAWVDSTQILSSGTARATIEFQQLEFGSFAGGYSAATIQFVNIKIDDDTEPGACSS
jgi:hypothetical protein